MKVLALIILFCVASEFFIGAIGAALAFRKQPPSFNQDEDRRRATAYVYGNWGHQIKAIKCVEGIAMLLLALLVLFG